MNTEQPDDKLWTSCKDCIFAIYDDNTQTECSHGRLAKFKKVGTNVVEATDDDKNYMVVERFCNKYREDAWMKGVKDKAKQVSKEIEIRCGVFIVLTKGKTIKDMEATILSCLKQKRVKPDYFVVVNNSDVSHPEVISRMHHTIKKKAIFYAVRALHVEATLDECVDLAFNQAKNGYYITFEAGYESLPNFLDKIDYLINEELETIILIKPEGRINGMFAQCAIHKILGGNIEKPLIKKIEDISKEENTEHVIRNWENVIND